MDHHSAFALRLGPLGPSEMHVESFTGRERLSQPFRFDVTLVTPVPRAVFERLTLGRSGVFVMRVARAIRALRGMAASILWEGARSVDGAEWYQARVRFVPHLHVTGLRKTSRIFRRMTADRAIAEVLGAWQLPASFTLAKRYPELDYITQYEETDLAFVQRLAAESGFLWRFEHPPTGVAQGLLDTRASSPARRVGGEAIVARLASNAAAFAEAELGPRELMVFSDQPTYPSLGALPFRPATGLGSVDEETVTSFSLRRSLQPARAVFRDYDPERPLTAIEASAEVGGPRSAAEAVNEPAELETYEHGGRHLFPEWNDAGEEPGRILRRQRRRARVGRGAAECARLAPGVQFSLDGHSEESPDEAYLVVGAKHRGGQSFHEAAAERQTYDNQFEVVPAHVTYMPPKPERRVVQACLTAIVAGPPGEEIHVNERGEIKVRFHWDREAPPTGDTSVWIRTMHAWSGAGWGSQFIPRVGMEVVVVFEAGDPDKPLVLGSLYNGVTPTPFPLPRDKTRSGLRTKSSPRSEGYNELSFEDKTSHEQVYLRAQRDFDTVVLRNRTATITEEDRTEVGKDRYVTVQGALRTEVTKERVTTLHADDRLDVMGARDVTIRSDLHERVVRDRAVRIEGCSRDEVHKDRTSLTHGDVTTDIRGGVAVLVGRAEDQRTASLLVEGHAEVRAKKAIDIASDDEIVLRCGSSSIRLSSGEVEIVSPKVTVRGKDTRLLLDEGEAKLKVKSKFQVLSDNQIVLKAVGASLGLSSQAKLDGASILLNSPEQATDVVEVNEPEKTTIELMDHDGAPLAYRRFRIKLDDGSESTGFLDEHGRAELLLEQAGDITFEDLPLAEQA